MCILYAVPFACVMVLKGCVRVPLTAMGVGVELKSPCQGALVMGWGAGLSKRNTHTHTQFTLYNHRSVCTRHGANLPSGAAWTQVIAFHINGPECSGNETTGGAGGGGWGGAVEVEN